MDESYFLDIDGVLNDADFCDSIDKENNEKGMSKICVDEVMVGYLKRIVEKVDAKIVLTSSLRWIFKKVDGIVVPITRYFAGDFIDILSKYNLSLYDLIPVIRDVNGREIKRQEEIKMWLSQNIGVESFVILDDETTELMDFVDTNLIILNNLQVGEMVCDMRDCIGLCKEHVEQAVCVLENKHFTKKLIRNKSWL